MKKSGDYVAKLGIKRKFSQFWLQNKYEIKNRIFLYFNYFLKIILKFS